MLKLSGLKPRSLCVCITSWLQDSGSHKGLVLSALYCCLAIDSSFCLQSAGVIQQFHIWELEKKRQSQKGAVNEIFDRNCESLVGWSHYQMVSGVLLLFVTYCNDPFFFCIDVNIRSHSAVVSPLFNTSPSPAALVFGASMWLSLGPTGHPW